MSIKKSSLKPGTEGEGKFSGLLEMFPPHLQLKSRGDGDSQHLEIKISEVGQEKQIQRIPLESHASNPRVGTPAEAAVRNQMPLPSFPLGYRDMKRLETQVFLSTHQYFILRADCSLK